MKKYLYFIEQVKKINARHDLSRYEIALLNLSARRYHANQPITVGELIRQEDIASQVTLHCAFKALVAKKLLATKYHDEDGRVKEVILTEAAQERYKHLDRAITRLPL
jgi:DNA-binding MarR family transcriptional regulator